MNIVAEKIIRLLELIDFAVKNANDISERSDRIALSGQVFGGFGTWARDLFQITEDQSFFRLDVDGIVTNEQELEDIIKSDGEGYSHWKITLNKEAYLKIIESPPGYSFFYKKTEFQKWLEKLDPFSSDGILPEESQKVIIVFNIEDKFGGPEFCIIPPVTFTEKEIIEKGTKLPSAQKVREHVHIHANRVSIRPSLFEIKLLSGEKPINDILLRNSFLTLSSALVQDFYSLDRVRVSGYRSLETNLLNSDEVPSLQEVNLLSTAVEWVYEERTDTRMKLLSERLSLDLSDKESLYSGLKQHLKEAFQQAREQYQFVILDRKDAYYRELRSVISELHGKSNAYSTKIKNLTDALFRDVLASLFLVAFGLFSKTDVNKIADLLENEYLLYLLKGLGIYFIVSFLFQLWNNWRDLSISRREMEYWLETTRNYLSKKEVGEIVKTALKNRRMNYYITVTVIGIVYVGIGLLCWFIGDIF